MADMCDAVKGAQKSRITAWRYFPDAKRIEVWVIRFIQNAITVSELIYPTSAVTQRRITTTQRQLLVHDGHQKTSQ